MCGICGVYYLDRERPVSEEVLADMRDTMVHRGPDGFGSHVAGHVGLGHRRLSIVDLEGGAQPMANEDESVWITFNGEIYNHEELRRELAAKGHRFRTRCDTEAIVHLYEEIGERCVERLQGMFAFALYDARRHRLLLARDRIGIKPLYYLRTPEMLLFGSEIKAILAHPEVRADVRWSAVPSFLQYGSVYGPETLFASIQELEPGHVLSVTLENVTRSRYWDLPAEEAPVSDLAEARTRLHELLELSIRRRMMSDVPLGAFLSGGVDSSLIVAMMTGMACEPVRTFSIGFGETGFNEFEYSRLVAEKYETEHHEFLLDAKVFFDALPDLVWHYDEPVSLPASIPLYFLSKETKGNATVILTGEGADEVFLGYERYPWVRRHMARARVFQALCPSFARSMVLATAQRLGGGGRKLLERLPMREAQIAASFLEWTSRKTADAMLASGAEKSAAAGCAEDFCLQAFDRSPAARDHMTRNTYLDFKTFLITLLMKQDKMSMAASIESRVPFLDHELVAFGTSLPTDWKLSGWKRKRILKEIAERYLPRELIYRKKQGFPVPVTPWLQSDSSRRRFEEIALDRNPRRSGIFDPEAIRKQIQNAGSPDPAVARASSYLVWSIVNFELWYRTFLDGARPRRATSAASLQATSTAQGTSSSVHG